MKIDMKKLYPTHDAIQVISSIVKDPDILNNKNYNITLDTFSSNFHRVVFAAIHNLIKQDMKTITSVAISEYLRSYNNSWYEIYDNFDRDNNYIEQILEINNLENFEYHYKRLKKFELLRDLVEVGFDVSRIYDTTETNPVINEKFETMNEEEILNIITLANNDLKSKWNCNIQSIGQSYMASDGIDELLSNLKESPSYGLPFTNIVFSTIFRGMRGKKIAVDAKSSGVGKSRFAIANAVKCSIPFIYDKNKKMWVKNGISVPSLYITSELELNEVQSIILATITSIPENKILDWNLTEEEEDILKKGVWILKQSPLHIVYIPDYSRYEIETIIERYVLQHSIRICFFDYLHICPSMLSEAAKLKINREDLTILMFVSALKQIASKYDIYIHIGSQTNRNIKDGENQQGAHSFRGSFAVLDKADFGILSTEVTEKEIEQLEPILSKLMCDKPNICHIVVKNRGNRYKNIRIFVKSDLSIMKEEIICITDMNFNPINIDLIEIEVDEIENADLILQRLNS